MGQAPVLEPPTRGVAMADQGKQDLDQAYEGLQNETPDRVSRAIRWLRNPEARWVRIPLGVVFILLSFGWFLPVVGLELLPIGLMLIAQDVPFLRKPVARAMMWLEVKWLELKRWWHHRRN